MSLLHSKPKPWMAATILLWGNCSSVSLWPTWTCIAARALYWFTDYTLGNNIPEELAVPWRLHSISNTVCCACSICELGWSTITSIIIIRSQMVFCLIIIITINIPVCPSSQVYGFQRPALALEVRFCFLDLGMMAVYRSFSRASVCAKRNVYEYNLWYCRSVHWSTVNIVAPPNYWIPAYANGC